MPAYTFLSWAWIEYRIVILPNDCNLLFATGFKNESSVKSFFLGSKSTTHHKILNINLLSLNETLIPIIDLASYLEYNAILIVPEITITLESLLGSLPIKWDVLQINRCAQIYQPDLLIDYNARQKYNLHIKHLKSYYVNLTKVRRNNNDYLSLLNQNKRRIHQSIK